MIRLGCVCFEVINGDMASFAGLVLIQTPIMCLGLKRRLLACFAHLGRIGRGQIHSRNCV